MGKPMAANLLKQGYPVVVYNRTVEKAIELLTLGADTAASPAEVTKQANVVITMVSDDTSLHEVYYGTDGIIHGLHAGMTVIDCSTVSPGLSKRIYKDLSDHFVDFLDAPVTGSEPAAIDGTLLFMVGGQQEALNEQMDIFNAMGRKVVYMGPSGSGSNTKLAHNTMVAIHNTALSEGLTLAVQAGVDPERFLEIVQGGAAGSRAAELKGPKIINRDFSPQFTLQLMLKDLRLASDLSNELKVPTPMLDQVKNLYHIAASKGLGEEDLCAIVQCYEEWANIKVKKITPPASVESKSAAWTTQAMDSGSERRRSTRLHLEIKLQLSVYQWEQEGSFSGQNIEGSLVDLSDSGLQILSSFPLAQDMFIVIHFPQEAKLPPITGKIIRIEHKEEKFRYGCMLAGLPPHVRIQLENYIAQHSRE